MKNIVFTLMIMSLIGQAFGQSLEKDQNPNYETSLKKYSEELKKSSNTMGTTVQDTYKAIDEWQDRKDAKIANRRLRIENRHERRMARINGRRGFYGANPGIYYNYPYYDNFHPTNPYFSNRYNGRRGIGVYPRIGCGIGIGANIGFGNAYLTF